MSDTPRTDAVNEFGDLNDLCGRLELELTVALARAEKAEADALLAAGLEDRYWQQAKKARAERDALRAALTKLAHYETLRPASKHDGKSRVIVWHWTTYIDGTAEWVPQWIHSVLPNHACWTPLPDVKEAK